MPDTDQPACPEIERGQVVPSFSLPGADGVMHSPWDYKQRQNLILLFIQTTTCAETRSLLRTFLQYYSDFREEMCAIIAITADTVIVNLQAQADLHLPFPLVSDVRGVVIQRYTCWDSATGTLTPALVLTDRYNALYERWIAQNKNSLPNIPELIKTLEFLNNLCRP